LVEQQTVEINDKEKEGEGVVKESQVNILDTFIP